MPNAKASGWIAGTAIVAILVLIASWFLLISPKLTSAQEDRDETATVQQHNEVLRAQLVTLKKQAEDLPASREELAALRKQIPTSAELAEYTRAFTALADAHSVVITAVTTGDAVPYVVRQGAAAPAATPTATPSPTATAGASPTDKATAAAAPSATPAAGAAAVPGLALVPMAITVVGTYQNVSAFMSDVQSKTDRLFLVTELSGKGQLKADTASGRPATALGDLELVVTGFAYVLQDLRGVEKAKEPNTGALPVPPAAKNPYLPLPGTTAG